MNDALRRIRPLPTMKNIAEQMDALAKFGKRGLTERTFERWQTVRSITRNDCYS